MNLSKLVEKGMKDSTGKEISISAQHRMLELSRSRYYYKPRPEKDKNLKAMRIMDELYMEYPTWGARRMRWYLEKYHGLKFSRKTVRELMLKAGLNAVYPQKSLTTQGAAKYRVPYLLRNLDIVRPNQVWSIDISYIPMRKGFMYLAGIIDVFSRALMGWKLASTLDTCESIEVFEQAVVVYGAPEIINSDQGCQYTSHAWHEAVKKAGTRISMDGVGRCKDNTRIERFRRTIKRDYIYPNPFDCAKDLRNGSAGCIFRYNNINGHSGVNMEIPMERYKKNKKSLTPDEEKRA